MTALDHAQTCLRVIDNGREKHTNEPERKAQFLIYSFLSYRTNAH